jgi:hypothetical protein
MVIVLDALTSATLENLIKIKRQNLKAFEQKARELAFNAFQQHKINIVFRIAKELQELSYNVEDIETYIIDSNDPHYIYKFAREIKYANIEKLQQAIIGTGKFNYIAKFACFINEANTQMIEDLIIQSNNARAAYIYLKFGKHPNAHKFKHIFIKSKKPRYLYMLAQLLSNQDELEIIQNLIIASHSAMYVRLFAAHIPGANIKKLEDRVLATQDFDEIKKFAKAVKSDRLNQLIMLM